MFLNIYDVSDYHVDLDDHVAVEATCSYRKIFSYHLHPIADLSLVGWDPFVIVWSVSASYADVCDPCDPCFDFCAFGDLCLCSDCDLLCDALRVSFDTPLEHIPILYLAVQHFLQFAQCPAHQPYARY